MQAERYRTLDALRGTAALIVVLYHGDALFDLGGWSPPLAFLAVDLFFCLSGFVLAKSYDRRLASGLSPLTFMRLRLQRLLPLYLLAWIFAQGASLAAGTFQLTVADIATTALNALMLPGIGTMFPSNPPAWSLFFELWVANLIFAAFWRHLHGWRLGTLIVLALAGVIAAERHFHDLNLGFEWNSSGGGFARVMFSYFTGVGLARLHDRCPGQARIPAIVLVAILWGVLGVPLGGQLRQLQQVICVTIVFPAIIYLGANPTEPVPKAGVALGEASYAVYVLHWPALVTGTLILRFFGVRPAGLLVQLSLTLAILLAAQLVHHHFDVPVRRLLALRRGSRRTAGGRRSRPLTPG